MISKFESSSPFSVRFTKNMHADQNFECETVAGERKRVREKVSNWIIVNFKRKYVLTSEPSRHQRQKLSNFYQSFRHTSTCVTRIRSHSSFSPIYIQQVVRERESEQTRKSAYAVPSEKGNNHWKIINSNEVMMLQCIQRQIHGTNLRLNRCAWHRYALIPTKRAKCDYMNFNKYWHLLVLYSLVRLRRPFICRQSYNKFSGKVFSCLSPEKKANPKFYIAALSLRMKQICGCFGSLYISRNTVALQRLLILSCATETAIRINSARNCTASCSQLTRKTCNQMLPQE